MLADTSFLEWMATPEEEEGEFQEIEKHRKTDDEVARHTVDEHLSPVERTLYLLRQGDLSQRHAAISGLQRMIEESGEGSILEVVAFMKGNLPKREESFQVAAGEVFVGLMESFKKLATIRACLPLAYEMIESKKEAVSKEWAPVIVVAITRLPEDDLPRICSFAVEKSSISQPAHTRTVAGILFSALVQRVDVATMERDFLQDVLHLCQDTEWEVRVCMAERIPLFSRSVGERYSVKHFFGELEELLDDEVEEVSDAALASYISLVSFFLDPSIQETMRNKIFSIIEGQEEHFIGVIVDNFGLLLDNLKFCMTAEEDYQFLQRVYYEAAHSDSPEQRKSCAENFPAVTKAYTPRRYATYLHPILIHLIDRETAVDARVAMAVLMPEVASTLGIEKTVKYLKDPWIQLLRDDSEEVRCTTMETARQMIPFFQTVDDAARWSVFVDVIRAFIAFDDQVRFRWRARVAMLRCLAEYFLLFPASEFVENILPRCFLYLSHGCVPEQQGAADLIAVTLRCIRDVGKRVEIFEKLRHDYLRSKSCSMRTQFLLVCSSILKIFSRKFFRDNLLDHVLHLAKDPVPNVRLRFVKLLPKLKEVVKPPSDVSVVARINERVSYLMMDRDRDVSEAAKEAHTKMQRLEVQFLEESRLGKSSADRQDASREDEEREWALNDAELEKRRRRGRTSVTSTGIHSTSGSGSASTASTSSTATTTSSSTSSTSSGDASLTSTRRRSSSTGGLKDRDKQHLSTLLKGGGKGAGGGVVAGSRIPGSVRRRGAGAGGGSGGSGGSGGGGIMRRGRDGKLALPGSLGPSKPRNGKRA